MADKITPRRGQHAPVDQEGPSKKLADWKAGSEGEEAGKVATGGDFGVHVEKATQADRDYTNRNTRVSDPGQSQAWSRENSDGDRTSGAGGHASGVGSSSGGDVDTDIIGVGTGGSTVSASGPSDRSGADDTDGTSDQFASGGHAEGKAAPRGDPFKGSTYTGESENEAVGGSDSAQNPARGDDSFSAEVSSGEARGEDNAIGGVGGDGS